MKENNFKPIQIKLAGVTHKNYQVHIKKWGSPDIGSYAVIREPDNPYDPNAIRVSLLDTWDMGYLPRSIAARLAPLMDEGRKFIAEFVQINSFPEITDTVGLTVRIVETTDE